MLAVARFGVEFARSRPVLAVAWFEGDNDLLSPSLGGRACGRSAWCRVRQIVLGKPYQVEAWPVTGSRSPEALGRFIAILKPEVQNDECLISPCPVLLRSPA